MMKVLKNIIFVLIGAMLLSACVKNDSTVYENAEAMVAAAKAEINTLSMDEFKALLDNHTPIQIIDCREDYDYILGHIPGAIHIPRGVLEFSDKISNRRLKTLVLGNEMGSGALAVQTLGLLKYSDCYLLDFSWFDWEATYPELVEQGMGGAQPEAPKKKESSGGCGG
ncbi:MAG TPA: rhodanese-like domain-containing protein [Bacteroidales bacterium]|nr:rhodanese-like domain-containing protein [Bacteroidales bacterium]